jgi:hypothetical protein
MKNKLIQSVPTAVMLAAIAFQYASNWCIDNASCYGTWVSHITFSFTQPLYFFALYSLPLAIILIFIPHPLFKRWFKVAVWLVPLLLIFIATQPVAPQSFMSTNRDDAARFAAEILTAASLIVIIWKYLALRRVRGK